MEQWIIPCNLNNYNVIGAFKKLKRLEWKQSNKIEIGDEAFIYITAPIKAIRYKCKVNKVNLDYAETEIDDSEFVPNELRDKIYSNYMELELVEEFDDTKYSLDVLRSKGLKGNMQGPRRAYGVVD